MAVILPRTCFISHSYADKSELDSLIEKLPPGVHPHIFPPITVPPDQLVSNKLFAAILACDGLIYLNGRHSSRSFWITFERDYALRAGKRVFAAAFNDFMLTAHEGDALDLPLFTSYHIHDATQVH